MSTVSIYIYIVEFAVLYHRSASFCVLCRPYSCFITGVVALLFYAGCRGLDALPDNTAHAADAHHVRLSEYHFLILPWHNFFWSSKGTLLFILPYMAESLEHDTRNEHDGKGHWHVREEARNTEHRNDQASAMGSNEVESKPLIHRKAGP